MAIELAQTTIPAIAEIVKYAGVGEFTVASNKTLKIKATGEDILNTDVPNGKTWTVRVELHIEEIDET